MDTYRSGRVQGAKHGPVQFERLIRAPVIRRGASTRDQRSRVPTALFNGRLKHGGRALKSHPVQRRSDAVPLTIATLLTAALLAVGMSVCTFADDTPAAPAVDSSSESGQAPAARPVEEFETARSRSATQADTSAGGFFVGNSELPPVPPLTADAYLLIDMDTNEILAERNSKIRRPVASLSKIAAALAVLSLAAPDQIVEIGPEAASMPPTRMGLVRGERLTIEELLYGLLLDSGNDAAYAIGDGAGGVDRLVAEMNEVARELHLKDTSFTNPAGFDEAENYSTAQEIAALTQFALVSQPLIRSIVSTQRRILEPNADHGWYGPTNLNRMLSEYPGTFGVKTGWTEDSGYVLIAASKQNGRRLMTVILGSSQHFSDASTLLDYGFGVYELRPAPRG